MHREVGEFSYNRLDLIWGEGSTHLTWIARRDWGDWMSFVMRLIWEWEWTQIVVIYAYTFPTKMPLEQICTQLIMRITTCYLMCGSVLLHRMHNEMITKS